jgi:hypothetical protein
MIRKNIQGKDLLGYKNILKTSRKRRKNKKK